MDKKKAKEIIRLNRKTYNQIAEEFSDTRNHLWSEISSFSDYIRNNQKILDLGCGNGRLINLIDNHQTDYIGVDNSKELIKIAKKKHPDYSFRIANITNLPFDKNNFDLIFSIAVIHHIPTQELRKKVAQEIKRVLKPGGKIIVSVWNLNRPKYTEKIKRSQLKNPDLEEGDWLKPWGKKKKHFRYYHAFSKEEFINLFENVDLEIKKRKFTRYNYWLVLKKE